MTLSCFVVTLILGALPAGVRSDPVPRYPFPQRHRHPHPAGSPFPSYLPTGQRSPRTPPQLALFARAPRPLPTLAAPRPHASPARHARRPYPGGCPVGESWFNETDLGAPCLIWAEVPPFLERSPPAGWAQLRGQRHNFCQSPDGAGRPWCFYANAQGKVDWGYCDCGHGERLLEEAGGPRAEGREGGSGRLALPWVISDKGRPRSSLPGPLKP